MYHQKLLLSLASLFAVQVSHATPTEFLPAGSAIPDGAWKGFTHPNGTMELTSLDTINARSVVIDAGQSLVTREVTRAPVSKRFTSCWGTLLDHSGTDQATQCLRDAGARAGGIDLQSGDGPYFFTCVFEAVQAYYCINRGNSYGNADLDDVNYGLSQMDANCPAYTASYFEWDGTVEIIGKAKADTAVCVGQ